MVEASKNNRSDVNKWIADAFKKENFEKIDVVVTGSGDKGEGYVGDIIFAIVIALTSNGFKKQFDVVLKCGKPDEELRGKVPIREANERELMFYSKIVPAFKEFEKEKNVELTDKFIVNCFGALLYEKQEILVLQNLRALGYSLYDKYTPFDVNHLKLTLEHYGKFHALSLAYKDQKPDEFRGLVENMDSIMDKFLDKNGDCVDESEKGFYSILEVLNETNLLKRIHARLPQGFLSALREASRMEQSCAVIIHGDCWNNNFMFKYNEQDKTRPEDVVFLDFQVSYLRSPVFDLSYHIYSSTTGRQLQHFKKLLQIYYTSLSNTLTQLGSDPDRVFPYSELVRHWKNYSFYGLIMTTLAAGVTLLDEDDLFDIQELNGNRVKLSYEKLKQRKDDRVSARFVGVAKHFLDFDDF